MDMYSWCYASRSIEDCVETGYLDSSTKDQLEFAEGIGYLLYYYLKELEDVKPSELGICTAEAPIRRSL